MKFYLLFVLLALQISAFAQKDWKLKNEREGIKIYLRDNPNSPIKELKVETIAHASIPAIVALVKDIPALTQWIYGCSEATKIEAVSETETYYYNRLDFPWPLDDRDLVGHSTMRKDDATGIVYLHTNSAPRYISTKEDAVRIEELSIDWKLTPLPNGTTRVDYHMTSNPGGSIPAWAVNMAIDKGPTETMLKFHEMLKQKKYQNVSFAFLK